MANELKYTYAASVGMETSGASLTNTSFAAAADSTLSSTNHSNYPLADFFLKTVGFSASIATGSQVVNLYRQDLDVAGDTSADATAPATSFKSIYVGSFTIPPLASNTTTYHTLIDVPISSNCVFAIENSCGQTFNAGWALTCAPKSYIPGA